MNKLYKVLLQILIKYALNNYKILHVNNQIKTKVNDFPSLNKLPKLSIMRSFVYSLLIIIQHCEINVCCYKKIILWLKLFFSTQYSHICYYPWH
jgi:hypothetical protein